MSKKKSKEPDIRKTPGFLPKYSDYYFEKKKQSRMGWIFATFYPSFLTFCADIDTHFEYFWMHVVCGVFGVLFVLVLVIEPLVLKGRKKLGIYLQPTQALRVGLWGKESPVYYSEMDAAVSSGRVSFEDTGIQIGQGPNKMVFHYEIGDSEAQKHVEECYGMLQSHIRAKLPRYEKKALDLLDRRFFYERSRKRCVLSLFLAVLSFWLFSLPGVNTLEYAIVLCAIFGIWDCVSLKTLFQSAVFSHRTTKALHEIYADYPHGHLGWDKSGYLWFGVMAVFTVLCNCAIILSL